MVSVDSSKFRKQTLAEICVGCMGCALVALAIAANQQWFDRHFLPAFFVTRAEYGWPGGVAPPNGNRQPNRSCCARLAFGGEDAAEPAGGDASAPVWN